MPDCNSWLKKNGECSCAALLYVITLNRLFTMINDSFVLFNNKPILCSAKANALSATFFA